MGAYAKKRKIETKKEPISMIFLAMELYFQSCFGQQ